MSAAGRMLERRHAGGGRARGVRLLLAALLLVAAAPRVSAQTEVVEYYGQDALGSIRIVFNDQGAAIARADYEPFGELFTVPTMPGTSGLPAKQFTGQERDAEASQDYFGARFLVPRMGRFSEIDPVYSGLFDPQQWNRYAYVRNNPLTFVDPTGRTPNPALCTKEIKQRNANDYHCQAPGTGTLQAAIIISLRPDLFRTPIRRKSDDDRRTRSARGTNRTGGVPGSEDQTGTGDQHTTDADVLLAEENLTVEPEGDDCSEARTYVGSVGGWAGIGVSGEATVSPYVQTSPFDVGLMLSMGSGTGFGFGAGPELGRLKGPAAAFRGLGTSTQVQFLVWATPAGVPLSVSSTVSTSGPYRGVTAWGPSPGYGGAVNQTRTAVASLGGTCR